MKLVTFMGLSEIPSKFHGVESQNFPMRVAMTPCVFENGEDLAQKLVVMGESLPTWQTCLFLYNDVLIENPSINCLNHTKYPQKTSHKEFVWTVKPNNLVVQRKQCVKAPASLQDPWPSQLRCGIEPSWSLCSLGDPVWNTQRLRQWIPISTSQRSQGTKTTQKRRPGDTSLTCRPIRRDASRPKLGGVEDFFWTRGAFPPENSRKHHGFFRVKHQRFGRIGIPAFEKPYLFGSRTVKPEISSAVSFFGGLFEDGIISIIGLRNDLTNLDWSHTQLDL